MHAAFAAIHGTPRLTVSMDRINVKPPVREGDERPWGGELGLHWDGPRPGQPGLHDELRVQGVLSLSDCPANGGGFRCIPGFPKLFAELSLIHI